MEHLKCSIQKRFVAFTEKLSNSPKHTVRYINRKIGKECRSITGANLRRIMLECDTESFNRPTRSEISRKGFEATPAGEEWRASMIRELIVVRDGVMGTIGWSPEEIEEALLHLCTT